MKSRWQKKEQRDAEDFGGKVTPRSGGFWSFPGDVKTDKFLIDAKSTEKNGYRVTKKVWNKIVDESIKSGKIPMLSLEIDDLELIVLDKNDFIALSEEENPI